MYDYSYCHDVLELLTSYMYEPAAGSNINHTDSTASWQETLVFPKRCAFHLMAANGFKVPLCSCIKEFIMSLRCYPEVDRKKSDMKRNKNGTSEGMVA